MLTSIEKIYFYFKQLSHFWNVLQLIVNYQRGAVWIIQAMNNPESICGQFGEVIWETEPHYLHVT